MSINGSDERNKDLDRTIDESLLEDIPQIQQFPRVVNVQNITNPYIHLNNTTTALNESSVSILPDGSTPLSLGSGVIDGVLGEGGMAKVYRIWNEQLEVHRAVKVFLPTGNAELMKRFETEIKITAKLHHPNIIEIYNVGEYKGLPYIEMELVDGVTVDSLITEFATIPSVVMAAIGVQVANALQYAHNHEFLLYGKTYKGIIHRDLKPANIVIGKNGVVKLLDFGIARPTEVGLHTVAGNIVGTLPYLSPEQMDDKDVDSRSDIYSLGTIMYEGLTGEKTFPQNTVTSLMKMKVTNSYRKFSSFPHDIFAPLGKTVEKSLSLNKFDRYETAVEFQKAISKIYNSLTDQPGEKLICNFTENPEMFYSSDKSKRFNKKKFYKRVFATTDKTVRFAKKLPLRKCAMVAVALLSISVIGVMFMTLLPFGKGSGENAKISSASTIPESDGFFDAVAANVHTVAVDEEDRKERERGEQEGEVVEQDEQVTEIEEQKPAPAVAAAPVTRPSVPQPRRESLIDRLIRLHGSEDMFRIGEAEYRAGNFSNAVTAFLKMPTDHPQRTKGQIMLVHSLLETNNLKKARSLITEINSNDAFFILMQGSIALKDDNHNRALNHFQTALTRPSQIKEAVVIRGDAMYYTAQIFHKRYTDDPSPESKQLAINAWNNLKRIYSSQPDNPRFKRAEQLINSY